MRRTSHVERCLLIELQRNPQQSYESLAAATGADRSTVIICVKRLLNRQRLQVERGRGSEPNRYVLL